MKLKEYKLDIVNFLINVNKETKTSGYVVGVSGGIDSALVYSLAKETRKKTIAIYINIESNEKYERNASDLAKSYNDTFIFLDLTKFYLEMVKILNLKTRVAKINLKSRIRMIVLYAYANEHNMLVLGTDNAVEYKLGYFTKYGDGAADVLPIIWLLKKEVIEMSNFFKIPKRILSEKPSADLEPNQSDEEEIGFKYSEIDKMFLNSNFDPLIKERIKNTNHKREKPLKPSMYKR